MKSIHWLVNFQWTYKVIAVYIKFIYEIYLVNRWWLIVITKNAFKSKPLMKKAEKKLNKHKQSPKSLFVSIKWLFSIKNWFGSFGYHLFFQLLLYSHSKWFIIKQHMITKKWRHRTKMWSIDYLSIEMGM